MLIQFGNLQIKLLIPILFPIFLKLRRLNRRNNKITSAVFKGFNDFLSLTLCGFFNLILLFNTKSSKDNQTKDQKKIKSKAELKPLENNDGLESAPKNESENEQNVKPNMIQNYLLEIKNKNTENEKKQKKRKIVYILIIAFLQFAAVIIKNIWKSKIEEALKLNISVLMEIIFFIFFSVKFLGLKIYSHQIFSIVGITILLMIFFIESLIYKSKQGFVGVLLSIIYYFVVSILYCLSGVLGKRYLNTFIDSIYSFLFKIGIVGLIPLTLYGIIISFVNIDNNNIKIFQIFYDISFGIYLLDLFFSLLFEIGLWLTIYYFTPCHYIIYESIADFLEIILSELENKQSFDEIYSKEQKITFFILYPIFIFIVLVFNEIIILNFCNLSFNTNIKIMERERKDILSYDIKDEELVEEDIEDIVNEGSS